MHWTTTCLLTTALAAPLAAHASVDYLLTIDGIAGDSTIEGHAGAIDATSFSWQITNPGALPGAGAPSAGKTKLGDLHFTKLVDKATPKLFSVAAGGTTLPKAELDFVKSGDRPFTYFKMTLADVMVSSITLAGDSGGAPTEAVTLSYDKLALQAIAQKPDGSAGDVVSGVWDARGFQGSGLVLQQLAAPATPLTAVPLPAALPLLIGDWGCSASVVGRRSD